MIKMIEGSYPLPRGNNNTTIKTFKIFYRIQTTVPISTKLETKAMSKWNLFISFLQLRSMNILRGNMVLKQWKYISFPETIVRFPTKHGYSIFGWSELIFVEFRSLTFSKTRYM